MSTSSVQPTLATFARFRFVALGGETSLAGADSNGAVLGYTPGLETVYINGVLQVRGSDYVGTSGTTIASLSPALVASDVVEVFTLSTFNIATNTVPSGGSIGQSLIADSTQASGSRWADDPQILTIMGANI